MSNNKFEESLKKVRSGSRNSFGWGNVDTKIEREGKMCKFVNPDMKVQKFPDFVKVFHDESNGVWLDKETPQPKVEQSPQMYAPINKNENFISDLKSVDIDFTDDFNERLHRSISQTITSLYSANFGKLNKIADLVVFPERHELVVKIVELANLHDVVLIPVGGSTNVTDSTHCPVNETRSIVVVDCTQMNRMLWIDEQNLLASFECGIVGKDMERILNEKGYTSGHEPDSIDFSTLGGWISTRASGMKRAKYGNIEEVVKDVKFVTSIGTISKPIYPRVAHGQSIRDVIFGSEGTLGIASEAVIKIHPLPEVVKYGSIIFPTFEHGLKFMQEMSKTSLIPASLRLIDNVHYAVGKLIKQSRGFFHDSMEPVKRGYLWYIKGFKEDEICFASFKIEGTKSESDQQEATVNECSKKYSGIIAGAYYGQSAYEITFLIGYIRDIFLEYGAMADSTETAVSWSKVREVIKALNILWQNENNREEKKSLRFAEKLGYRISQIYHDGVCLYIYYGIFYKNLTSECRDDFSDLREKLINTIRDAGGSLSHHHGIGKKMQSRYIENISSVEKEFLQAVKNELDPKNIFANGNLMQQKLSKL